MKKICLFIAILIHSSNLFAWNANGHKLIAAIAYSQLNDLQKNEVTEILKFHPEYEKNWAKKYSKVSDVMDLGEFLMMRSSVWPDEIRGSSNTNFKYHKSEWHFITYRIEFPNLHDTTLTDSEIEFSVVGASAFSKTMFANKLIDNSLRAIYLSWFIHLIGDIHQPLHCGTLFNSNYPKGDRGGNKFFVKPNSAGVKLHTLWDGALGNSSNDGEVHNQSLRIKNVFLFSENLLDIDNYQPKKWSIKSFQHTLNEVHIAGKLEGSTSKENAPLLPVDYTKNMKELAEKEVR